MNEEQIKICDAAIEKFEPKYRVDYKRIHDRDRDDKVGMLIIRTKNDYVAYNIQDITVEQWRDGYEDKAMRALEEIEE